MVSGGGKKRERGEPDAERVTLRKGNLKKRDPGGEGVPLRTKVSKSGGVFQFFGGRMTSRGQCPKGGACECPRVGVFFNFPEGG